VRDECYYKLLLLFHNFTNNKYKYKYKMNEQNKKLLDKKERIKDLRKMKAENEEFTKEIEYLTSNCFALSENIKYEHEKNQSLKGEIQFRVNHLEEIEKQYTSVVDEKNPESKKYVIELKNKIIKKKLEEILIEKIPEISVSANKNDNKEEINQNEFHNLVFDHVMLIFTTYETSPTESIANPLSHNKREDKQNFRISKLSTFKNLKKIACMFWDIDNDNDYAITDEAEALIYNEDMKIDTFLKDYSVLGNCFRLMSYPHLKTRNKLTGIQEHRMKEANKIYDKNKKENFEVYGGGSSAVKIKDFFNEYPGLKPFTLISSEDKSGSEAISKKSDVQTQAKNIETSFWMLLLLILFFVLNLSFIYGGGRDVGRNNIKISYVKFLLDNSKVTDYKSFYKYLVETIGMNFMSTSNTTDQLDTDDFSESLLNALGSVSYIKTKESGNDTYILNEPLYKYANNTRTAKVGFLLGSSIHFIVAKVKSKESCSTNSILASIILKTDVCYHEFYDSDTVKKDFKTSDLDAQFYLKDIRFMQLFGSQLQQGYRSAADSDIHLDVFY
jgi:hypothetical protein